MRYANGPPHRREQYKIRLLNDHHHKSHPATTSSRKIINYNRHHINNYIKMSSVDDRNNKSNANAPRGRRGGGRAYRARARGRGFHSNQSAQEALTQHLMHRGRGLQPAASDPISLTIGNYHDAPLNARKLDKQERVPNSSQSQQHP